ncbi:MAG: hypothetical protein FJ404_18215 [Verrucomicrobia bacterium]|nr:hypothetical protein [Verrucomicrobiota bacterium]
MEYPRPTGPRSPSCVTLLFGPAGSGKTWRCQREIVDALRRDPEGLPMILLVPRQATYQWERSILSEPGLRGYTRLQIVSFERLADWILRQLGTPSTGFLSEQGRGMVLRALLTRHQSELRFFCASARLPGFASELSGALRELQHARLNSGRLSEIAAQAPSPLREKILDLALLLQSYRSWLDDRQLRDAEYRLELAAERLRSSDPARLPFALEGVWMDGFADLTPQEIELLSILLPRARQSTLAFCLEHSPEAPPTWLSTWSAMAQACRQLLHRIQSVEGLDLKSETLARSGRTSRFTNAPELAEIERRWSDLSRPRQAFAKEDTTAPQPEVSLSPDSNFGSALNQAAPSSVRLLQCAHPEAEAEEAARAILHHVRDRGGRFRDIALLVRDLESHHAPLRRVLRRFGIPFFMDRREPIAHHPLLELSRAALRFGIFGIKSEDLLGALKTGLFEVSREEVDWLESEILARGWQGDLWRQRLELKDEPHLADRVENLRRRLLPPLLDFADLLKAPTLDGPTLANGLQALWAQLHLDAQSHEEESGPEETSSRAARWSTVWREVQAWLQDLSLGFTGVELAPPAWLPIVETGLGGLTAGLIPPALDQVLVGAVDRARNPDVKTVVVLGLNEGLFPRRPVPPTLLSESDRAELEGHGARLRGGIRTQIGLEWFFGYIAVTRSRESLWMTFSEKSSEGEPLNPSPFVSHLQRLLPGLRPEHPPPVRPWWQAARVQDCIPALARGDRQLLERWNELGPSVQAWRAFHPPAQTELTPITAAALYGEPLRTSVSRVERFAECPFHFFVESGLRARERRHFEIDFKEAGNLQHELLEAWHHLALERRGAWRNVSPEEGRRWMQELADARLPRSGGGRFAATPTTRARAEGLVETLKDWIEAFLRWMPHYGFEPTLVETSFGREGDPYDPWKLELDGGRRLEFRGKIDRIDLGPAAPGQPIPAVVVDYKISIRKFKSPFFAAGVQLQLAAYLAVLKHLQPREGAGAFDRCAPVGGFYANLKGEWENGHPGAETADPFQPLWKSYRHYGRFLKEWARTLSQDRDNSEAGLFNFKADAEGKIDGRFSDPIDAHPFETMLRHVETKLREFGNRIYAGEIRLDPYREGSTTACERCDFQPVCRIDPVRHTFRSLKTRETSTDPAGTSAPPVEPKSKRRAKSSPPS